MSLVNITWSTSLGGAALLEDVDFSTIAGGAVSDAEDLYLTTDEDIADCVFYARPYSGLYSGDGSASDDYNEILNWGLIGSTYADGGLSLNQNVSSPSWTRFTPSVGTSTTGITLATTAGASAPLATAGELLTTETAHIQLRMAVPAAETVVGVRQIDFCLYFSFDA